MTLILFPLERRPDRQVEVEETENATERLQEEQHHRRRMEAPQPSLIQFRRAVAVDIFHFSLRCSVFLVRQSQVECLWIENTLSITNDNRN